jgi:hypothetical protein
MVVSAEFLFQDIDNSEFVKRGGYAMCIWSSLRDKRPGPPEGFDFLAVQCSSGVWVETAHGGGDDDREQETVKSREEGRRCRRRRKRRQHKSRGDKDEAQV